MKSLTGTEPLHTHKFGVRSVQGVNPIFGALTFFQLLVCVFLFSQGANSQGFETLTDRLEQFAQAARVGDVETVYEMRPPELVEMMREGSGEAGSVFETTYKAELARMLPMEIEIDARTVAEVERLYATECIHTPVSRIVEGREKGTFFRMGFKVVLFKEDGSWYIVGPSTKRENEALDALCPLWRM